MCYTTRLFSRSFSLLLRVYITYSIQFLIASLLGLPRGKRDNCYLPSYSASVLPPPTATTCVLVFFVIMARSTCPRSTALAMIYRLHHSTHISVFSLSRLTFVWPSFVSNKSYSDEITSRCTENLNQSSFTPFLIFGRDKIENSNADANDACTTFRTNTF